MFTGHFAVGLAARKAAPNTSFPVLLTAAIFLDILWPPLVLLGIEHFRIDPGNTAVTPLDFYDYPISHSLATTVVWSVLFALVYFFFTRYGRGAFIAGLAVASHWLLDFITHAPDLPIVPGGTRYGLALWNSVAGTAAVELGMFALAVWVYTGLTRAKGPAGKFSFWSLIIFLVVMQVWAYQGTPPPSERMVAWMGIVSWVFILWAWWIEKTRRLAGGK
ncbi:MAG TPA: hypothetical protein VJ417_15830 [Candidatus Glassbacteria bacterium]|nr:hypothetical protein [Candidatus Glassbacteria bacterium]